MKTKVMACALCISGWMGAGAQNGQGLADTSKSPWARVKPTELNAVRWTGGFWGERFEVCRHTMSPELMKTYLDEHISHAFKNFEIAAGLDTGSHQGPPFHDGDFYKAFEALASLYAVTRDESLDRLMDRIVPVIAQSQRKDGYIHTPVLIEERKQENAVQPFAERLHFETYNLGHLMTAACIHFRATGKRSLLEVAIGATNYLYRFYKQASPELARNAICPSHYMGVVEMYRTTGNPEYLELAQSLIDIRGLMENGTDDNQDRIPFRQQTRAMGHAVRANYLYAGAADVYAETGDTTLLRPLRLIWENVTQTKMYITGGCGALYDGVSPDGVSYNPPDIQKVHQAYGRDFQLPNQTAHNETCANIGNLLWNWRMFLITGDARYVDVLELELYNSILSGVSLDGRDFCYTNPLRVTSDFPYPLRWAGGRTPYIALSNCCPPNTVRTLSEVQNYAYSLSAEGIWVNLYGSNELTVTDGGGNRIGLRQTSDYPWEGNVRLQVTQAAGGEFSLFLRIPGWCSGAKLRVKGREQAAGLPSGAYVEIRRRWEAGDEIELDLPLDVKLMESHPLVEETRNQVAVKRGPVVYCVESVDNSGVKIADLVLPSDMHFSLRETDLNGSRLLALEGMAKVAEAVDWRQTLYREIRPALRSAPVQLIPYYAWGNRGKSEMSVWLNVSH